MKTTSLLITTALTALAVAAPAPASETAPPLPGGVKCKQKVKRTYKLSTIERTGIPFKVKCDGPAQFFVQPDFAANTKASQEASSLFPRGVPGIATVPHGKLDRAGTVTLRPKLRPWAKRVLRKYPKTKLLVGMGTKREDGKWWSSPGDWAYTVVVR